MENSNFLEKKEKGDTWKNFIDKTKDNEPRKYLVDAIKYVTEKEMALDIGAGSLRDAKHLLNSGFEKVVAVDSHPMIEEIEKEINNGRLETVVSSFENFDYSQNTYDIINAQYSLPFIEKAQFQDVINQIKKALKPNGIFVGTFFGNNDDWNKGNHSAKNFQTREDVKDMFQEFEELEFLEKEEDKFFKKNRTKHWHTFHTTFRKL